MIDVKTLKKGDKVRIVNNQDNNVSFIDFVKVGDVATFDGKISDDKLYLSCPNWSYKVWFEPEQLEYLESGGVTTATIYKSRWDEIINNLRGWYGMTDEEVKVVRSVLKDNAPFCVVDDPIDPVISKEEQTHLDATHVGDTGNCALYYKSEILKKWFWWNDEYTWEECYFKYEDKTEDLFQITISKSI